MRHAGEIQDIFGSYRIRLYDTAYNYQLMQSKKVELNVGYGNKEREREGDTYAFTMTTSARRESDHLEKKKHASFSGRYLKFY